MTMITYPRLTDLAREQATFVRYDDGELWYSIAWSASLGVFGGYFLFPIDVRDTNDTGGSFGSSEKGITLIRWIKRHMELLQSAREEAGC